MYHKIKSNYSIMKYKTKTCKKCGNEYKQFNSLDKCNSLECRIEIQTKQALKNLKEYKISESKRIKEIKDNIRPRTELLKLAQITFNAYIRKRDANEPCISCGTKTGKMNAGHYYSAGGHSNIRFDEFNVFRQCEYCNNHLSGNLIPYGINLEKKIGKLEFDLLRERAYEPKKWDIDEIRYITNKYKEMLKKM